MNEQQIAYANEMKTKCIVKAHKAARELDIEKAQLMYHEARLWEEAVQELRYGYKVAA